MIVSASTDPSAGGTAAVIITVVLAAAGILLYFLPLFIGARRRVRHLAALAVVNVLTGWTGIGWVAALVMAVWPDREAPVSRSASG